MIVEAAITGVTLGAFTALTTIHFALRRMPQVSPVAAIRVEPVLPRPEPEPPATEPEIRAAVRRASRPKLIVAQARAAEILIEFMNGHSLTGYFTAKEIDEHWAWCAAERDIEPMSPGYVREALGKHRIGQRRVNSPQYARLKQRNPATVRPVIYNIPKVRAKSVENQDSPGSVRADLGPSGKPAAPVAGRLPPDSQSESIRRAIAC